MSRCASGPSSVSRISPVVSASSRPTGYSRRELGSRVDRHEHIGRGRLGLEPFRFLLNDRRFRNIPMYLETPKEGEEKTDWDLVNLAALRELVV
mgnify:CR=1 FL=1